MVGCGVKVNWSLRTNSITIQCVSWFMRIVLLCLVLLWLCDGVWWIYVINASISFKNDLLALRQAYDGPGTSEVTLKDMGQIVPYTTQHNNRRTLCSTIGLKCMCSWSRVQMDVQRSNETYCTTFYQWLIGVWTLLILIAKAIKRDGQTPCKCIANCLVILYVQQSLGRLYINMSDL